MSRVKVYYFASLREALGVDSEIIDLADTAIKTVAALQDYLVNSRGDAWSILSARSTRVAVNQQLADSSSVLGDGDEIAFFPPVTGG